MTGPQPVHIIRPQISRRDLTATLIGTFLLPLYRALLVWWLAPLAWNEYTMSYWQTVALVVAARAVIRSNGNDYKWWTRDYSEVAR